MNGVQTLLQIVWAIVVLMMNHCLYKHRQNTKYLLFVDLDEILVFKSGNMEKFMNEIMFDKDFAWVKFDNYDIYPLQHSNLQTENTTHTSFCTGHFVQVV